MKLVILAEPLKTPNKPPYASSSYVYDGVEYVRLVVTLNIV